MTEDKKFICSLKDCFEQKNLCCRSCPKENKEDCIHIACEPSNYDSDCEYQTEEEVKENEKR